MERLSWWLRRLLQTKLVTLQQWRVSCRTYSTTCRRATLERFRCVPRTRQFSSGEHTLLPQIHFTFQISSPLTFFHLPGPTSSVRRSLLLLHLVALASFPSLTHKLSVFLQTWYRHSWHTTVPSTRTRQSCARPTLRSNWFATCFVILQRACGSISREEHGKIPDFGELVSAHRVC